MILEDCSGPRSISDLCAAVCSFPMVPLNISVSTCINNACFQQLNASSFVVGFCLKKEVYIYITPEQHLWSVSQSYFAGHGNMDERLNIYILAFIRTGMGWGAWKVERNKPDLQVVNTLCPLHQLALYPTCFLCRQHDSGSMLSKGAQIGQCTILLINQNKTGVPPRPSQTVNTWIHVKVRMGRRQQNSWTHRRGIHTDLHRRGIQTDLHRGGIHTEIHTEEE